MALGLKVTFDVQENKKIVRLEGRLDANTSSHLENQMAKVLEKGKSLLLLDFSHVDYLSSAGLRLLLALAKKIKAQGGKLVLSTLSAEVMEIIKMAGFERILAIYPTEEEALNALG